MDESHLKHTNIVRLKLLQRVANSNVKAAAGIPSEISRLWAFSQGMAAIIHAELGGQDQRVAVLAGVNPLANPQLRLLVLVHIGSIDKIATGLIEGIEKLE